MLDIGKVEWENNKSYSFRKCLAPGQMGIEKDQFNISVSIETLEHVPTEMVSPYSELLANALKK